MDGGVVLFFLKHDGHIAIGTEADAVVIDACNQFQRDEMVVAFMAGAAVFLGQLDTVAFDAIDRSDMKTVGADYFGMLSDRVTSTIGALLLWFCQNA